MDYEKNSWLENGITTYVGTGIYVGSESGFLMAQSAFNQKNYTGGNSHNELKSSYIRYKTEHRGVV